MCDPHQEWHLKNGSIIELRDSENYDHLESAREEESLMLTAGEYGVPKDGFCTDPYCGGKLEPCGGCGGMLCQICGAEYR